MAVFRNFRFTDNEDFSIITVEEGSYLSIRRRLFLVRSRMDLRRYFGSFREIAICREYGKHLDSNRFWLIKRFKVQILGDGITKTPFLNRSGSLTVLIIIPRLIWRLRGKGLFTFDDHLTRGLGRATV